MSVGGVPRAVLHRFGGASERLLAPLRGVAPALRQSASLGETGHRPWPLPDEPWLMGQSWEDLLFAHWSLPPEAVRPLVPAPLELDVRDGMAWLGVTPFEVTGLRAPGTLPVPGISRFAELNVRTYATIDGRPGIHFLSLDAASRLAVAAARCSYRLPYFHAAMEIDRDGGWTSYRSDRRSGPAAAARFDARYRPAGAPLPIVDGSLDRWLTERYCLYVVERGEVHRADIHHAPWPLQPAQAQIAVNTMTAPQGLRLPSGQPLLHYSRRQDVVIWPLRRVA